MGTTKMTATKAYAAAVVAVLLFVANGLFTGEWASTESIAPALTIILTPWVVYAVPNREVPENIATEEATTNE